MLNFFTGFYSLAFIMSPSRKPLSSSQVATKKVLHLDDSSVVLGATGALCKSFGLLYKGMLGWDELYGEFTKINPQEERLFLSDLEMPAMPVEKLLIPLIRHHPHLLVFFYTASPDKALEVCHAMKEEHPALEMAISRIQVIAKKNTQRIKEVLTAFKEGRLQQAVHTPIETLC